MSPLHIPQRGGEQVHVLLDLVGDLITGEALRPRRGQLDGQWETIHATADTSHGRPFLTPIKIDMQTAYPVIEEFHRAVSFEGPIASSKAVLHCWDS